MLRQFCDRDFLEEKWHFSSLEKIFIRVTGRELA